MAQPVIELPPSSDTSGTVEFLRDLHDPGWRWKHRDPVLVDLFHRLARVLARETDVDVGFEPQPSPSFRFTRGRRDLWIRPQGGKIWLRAGGPDEEEIATKLAWDESTGRYGGDPMLEIMKALAPRLWPERFEEDGSPKTR